ncbi:MAG: hypothetical protein IPM54_32875 [Polyangiaceae bacterium]|nr:hypothetical protein [Polyangiaceae bacterium]
MRTGQAFFVVLALGAGVAACGGESTPDTKTPVATTTPPADSAVAATPPPAEKKAPPPVVEDMKPSDDPTPLPSVKITSPKNDASVGDLAKAKDFEVKLDVKDWATVEGGPHVHLILDGLPYKPIYDTAKPVKLSELLMGTELAEGEHTLVAFASRATHESVKGAGAQALVTFWVGKKGKAAFDPKKPHLVYSRPKGENKGSMAQELLLDFYLFGTKLDNGEKVKYSITGGGLEAPLTGEFTTWAPKIAKHLPKGDYEVTVELVDKDGKAFEGPLTKTTRKGIKLDPEGVADMGHGGAHGAPAAPEKK